MRNGLRIIKSENHFHLIVRVLEFDLFLPYACIWKRFGALIILLPLLISISQLRFLINAEAPIFFSKTSSIYLFC